MHIIDPHTVREAMRSIFGTERYSKFVAELNGSCKSKKRLFYWQETMWKEVQKSVGMEISDFETIASFFHHCHIHGSELERGMVPVLYGTWQPTGKYIEAMESLFPCANTDFLGPCWSESSAEQEVSFCSQCRAAKKVWELQQGS